MAQDPRLEQEPHAWLLASLEDRAVKLLLDEYRTDPEIIAAIRERGANTVPCLPPRQEVTRDYSVPWGESGFWVVRPQDATEQQALETLTKVHQIRSVIAEGDAFAIAALSWQWGFDTANFAHETRYAKRFKSERESRNEALAAQIQFWVDENPRIKNTEIARRLREDPQYSEMTSSIKDLRIFVSRLRRKMVPI